MSYPHSKPISIGHLFPNVLDPLSEVDRSLPFVQSTDNSIDAALRSVPLPDGFLSRLTNLAYTVSDEAIDSVDYLGC